MTQAASRRGLRRSCACDRRIFDRRGFSIVEILVVLALVGLAMLPLAGVQVGSQRDVTEAGRHVQAVEIAQTQLEVMRAAGFGQAAPDTGFVGSLGFVSSVIPINGSLEEYRVTVSWQDGSDTRSLTLSCLQSQR